MARGGKSDRTANGWGCPQLTFTSVQGGTYRAEPQSAR